jgi:hypothetical protein
MKRTLTISVLAIAVAVMLIAGVTAPRTRATTGLCHKTALSIKAPATATAGQKITVTGSLTRKPSHKVKATLQSRLSTSTAWVNGTSTTLAGSNYSIKWTVPSTKATYKVRVRVTYLGASHASAAKTLTVK